MTKYWKFVVGAIVLIAWLYVIALVAMDVEAKNWKPIVDSLQEITTDQAYLLRQREEDYVTLSDNLIPLQDRLVELEYTNVSLNDLLETELVVNAGLREEIRVLRDTGLSDWSEKMELYNVDALNRGISFSSGAWMVGVEIVYGAFRADNPIITYADTGKPISHCEWRIGVGFSSGHRSSRTSGQGALHTIVHLQAGDKVFWSQYCGTWEWIGP